jgi:hypothetical protein
MGEIEPPTCRFSVTSPTVQDMSPVAPVVVNAMRATAETI